MRKGLTLIEVLIAMGVSAFIFILLGSFFSNVVLSNSRQKSQEQFEQAKNDMINDISDTVKWGKVLSCTNCNCGSGNPPNGTLTVDSATYSLTSNQLMKAGTSITPNNVTITNFYVCNISAARTKTAGVWTTDYPSYKITIGLQAKSGAYTYTDSMNFVVSNRKQTITK
jgi:prepilin-type N-terminal cleavage/methylation domain-containing protein